jgi:anti-sigma regulatory factor (Ser/Thr protein kinase)
MLALHSTPVEVIAAMRDRVFACFTPPLDASRSPTWPRVRHRRANGGTISKCCPPSQARCQSVNCRLITAERLMTFAQELSVRVPERARQDTILTLREILLNAMEHGAGFNPEQVVEVTAVRTARSFVFHVQDRGAAAIGREPMTHAAVGNPDHDRAARIAQHDHEGLRAGGYGLLLALGRWMNSGRGSTKRAFESRR